MIFFTADEHYGHKNIIRYTDRPWKTVPEMTRALIEYHNAVVCQEDTVVHVGDTFWGTHKEMIAHVLSRLNGTHIFLKGSHDRWLKQDAPVLWERKIEGQYIVACHYAMRTWPRSHYGSWQVHGHSHGKLPMAYNQWDVGVDNNNYTPVSFEQLKEIMARLDKGL